MSSIYTIQSEFISAKISLSGAKLISLYDFETNVEYIQKTDEVERIPGVFFPIVGRLQEDRYRIKNKFYNLQKDGHAQDKKFEVLFSGKDHLTLKLESNEESLKSFPYHYHLIVTYKVYGPKLYIDYEVRNRDKKDLLFSLGKTNLYNIPLLDDQIEEYYLEFEQEEEGFYYLNSEGLVNFSMPPDKRPFKGRIVQLEKTFFQGQTLILKDPLSSKVSVKSVNHDNFFTIDFKSIPYLGISADKKKPGLVIGCWYGVADSTDSNFDFYEKEGLQELLAGDNYKSGYVVTVG